MVAVMIRGRLLLYGVKCMRTDLARPIPASGSLTSTNTPGQALAVHSRAPTKFAQALPVAQWAEGEGFHVVIARRASRVDTVIAAFFLRPLPLWVAGRLAS